MVVPIGQKRKRVTRASQAAAANINLDAFASYHPPPRPPIKAKDVYVMQVQDVSDHFGAFKSPHISRVAPEGNIEEEDFQTFGGFFFLMLQLVSCADVIHDRMIVI